MRDYKYVAIDAKGKTVSGVISAISQKEAKLQVGKQKLMLLKIESKSSKVSAGTGPKPAKAEKGRETEVKKLSKGSNKGEKVGLEFLKRLHELHSSGMPIADSVKLLNSRLSDQLNSTETEGFFVSGLEINMGAYEAGIKEKDVIIKVDNADIKKFSDLTGYLNTKRPGDLVNVTVIRDSEVLNFEVKLKKTPYVLFYGMRVRNMNENETKKFNGQNGLVISDLQNNRLYSRGIETGDILISINGNSIYDKEDLNKIELNSIFELEFMNKNGEKMRFIFE